MDPRGHALDSITLDRIASPNTFNMRPSQLFADWTLNDHDQCR